MQGTILTGEADLHQVLDGIALASLLNLLLSVVFTFVTAGVQHALNII